MENRQYEIELGEIGGEPLNGSGFENEASDVKDEVAFTISPDQHKGDAS
jgi:hypothetical protein